MVSWWKLSSWKRHSDSMRLGAVDVEAVSVSVIVFIAVGFNEADGLFLRRGEVE